VIQEALLASGVLNTYCTGEHVAVIKRSIGTIKKMVQGLLLALPFKRIPELMLTQAVVFSVM
jgi:hypothetical protein